MEGQTYKELAGRAKEAYTAGKLEVAVNLYTQAIIKEPTVKELFVGRLKAYLKLGRGDKALEDAMSCNLLDRKWAPSYYYLGVCYKATNDLNHAADAFRKGLQIDPEDKRLKNELHALEGSGISSMLGGLFGPDMFKKLRAYPETAKMLEDREFKEKLMTIRDNPSCLIDYMNDPNIAKCLQILSGVTDQFVQRVHDMQTEQMEEYKRQEEEEKRKEEVVTELEKEVIAIKEEGTALYKAKSFEDAIKKYKEAKKKVVDVAKEEIEDYEKKLDIRMKIDDINKNTSIHDFIEVIPAYRNLNAICLNISAVYFTMKEYEKSRKWAEKAIKYSDFTKNTDKNKDFISRCYLRVGNCYIKLGNDKDAVIELTKGRDVKSTEDIRRLIRECKDREVERKKARHVLSPDNCPALISLGNNEMKNNNYEKAIEYYTEALKNDETCMEAYNDRATAYYKNGNYLLAIDDCEGIFKMSLSFAGKDAKRVTGQMQIQRNIVRAFIREGLCYQALGNYHKAVHYYFKARLMEPWNDDIQHNLETLDRLVNEHRQELIAKRQENMKDDIIKDLIEADDVKKCLEDIYKNPSRVSHYMEDRNMSEKLITLKCAGVI